MDLGYWLFVSSQGQNVLTLQLIGLAIFAIALVYSLRIYSKPLYLGYWFLGLWDWLVSPLARWIERRRAPQIRAQAKSLNFSLAAHFPFGFAAMASREAFALEELQLKTQRLLQAAGQGRGEARLHIHFAVARAKSAAEESVESTEWHLRRELAALEARFSAHVAPFEPSKLTIQEFTKAWCEAWPEFKRFQLRTREGSS